MKKLISVFLCAVILCLSFTACSGPNADMTEENITATVKAAETALKEFDIDELNKYVDSSTLSIILSYAKKHDQFAQLGKAIFENLKMDVKSIDIENKTVTVSVSNKDLYQAAGDFAAKLKADYSSFQLLTKLNDEQFLDNRLNSLCKEINNADFLPDSVEITLSIEEGSKNLTLRFNDEAENAVSGGALSAIKGIYSAK